MTAPTLLIQNRDDVHVRAGHGRYLVENIPGAWLLQRDSADHWPIPEPDLLGAIEEFITGSRVEEPDVKRILTTVIFVDVVGSTERVSELVARDLRRPARAIRCACEIRDSIQRTGLEVRCGLHTGEVSARNGDVAGIAVHIGARVSTIADPGEVLVTRTVRDLVAGSGIAFAEKGVFALKGVADQWDLYATSN
jgi:class 3 adenylate cyclase